MAYTLVIDRAGGLRWLAGRVSEGRRRLKHHTPWQGSLSAIKVTTRLTKLRLNFASMIREKLDGRNKDECEYMDTCLTKQLSRVNAKKSGNEKGARVATTNMEIKIQGKETGE